MSDPVTRLNAALAGRYTIERELGEGGMATVYLADDLKHERKVALKVLKPELAAVVGAERFLAEIKTTANLQHPHILALHDSGKADGLVFYVMPFIEGESLRDKLDREKQLSVEETLEITKGVASALDYAHRRDVIHRDIKPANILLQDGQPVVADFGIALAVSAAGTRLTETGLSLGTPHYMSAEQAMGDRELDARSDVYSLACVTYEMLVGEPPYTGPTAQAIVAKLITEKAQSITQHRDTVPAHIDAAVQKALSKLPADRFTGAQDFAEALADSTFRRGQVVGVGGVLAGPTWNRLTLATTGLAAVFALGVRVGTHAFRAGSAGDPSDPEHGGMGRVGRAARALGGAGSQRVEHGAPDGIGRAARARLEDAGLGRDLADSGHGGRHGRRLLPRRPVGRLSDPRRAHQGYSLP